MKQDNRKTKRETKDNSEQQDADIISSYSQRNTIKIRIQQWKTHLKTRPDVHFLEANTACNRKENANKTWQ
jgi:hypothetical protein